MHSWFLHRLSAYCPPDIAGQSMRAGGATALAEAGAPGKLIRGPVDGPRTHSRDTFERMSLCYTHSYSSAHFTIHMDLNIWTISLLSFFYQTSALLWTVTYTGISTSHPTMYSSLLFFHFPQTHHKKKKPLLPSLLLVFDTFTNNAKVCQACFAGRLFTS